MANMKAVALEGDPTMLGGIITEGMSDVQFEGRGVVTIGHDHRCPTHGNSGPVIEATSSVFIHGMQLARAGDALLCVPDDPGLREEILLKTMEKLDADMSVLMTLYDDWRKQGRQGEVDLGDDDAREALWEIIMIQDEFDQWLTSKYIQSNPYTIEPKMAALALTASLENGTFPPQQALTLMAMEVARPNLESLLTEGVSIEQNTEEGARSLGRSKIAMDTLRADFTTAYYFDLDKCDNKLHDDPERQDRDGAKAIAMLDEYDEASAAALIETLKGEDMLRVTPQEDGYRVVPTEAFLVQNIILTNQLFNQIKSTDIPLIDGKPPPELAYTMFNLTTEGARRYLQFVTQEMSDPITPESVVEFIKGENLLRPPAPESPATCTLPTVQEAGVQVWPKTSKKVVKYDLYYLFYEVLFEQAFGQCDEIIATASTVFAGA